MKFEDEDLARFIELILDLKNVTIVRVVKDTVMFRDDTDRRKTKKRNLHDLCVTGLAKLSSEYNVFVRINKNNCTFKVGKFKMESEIKNWITTIIFIVLLKLKRDKND